MKKSSSALRKPKWGVTLWRSGSGESDWRHWNMVYTNQEMDSFLKMTSLKYLGQHAGDPGLSKGFDEDHFTLIFESAISTGQNQESVLRFSLPKVGISELFLLCYVVPLDQNHYAALITPIETHYVPENFNQEPLNIIKGPQHYGLEPALVEDLENQIQRVKAMLGEW